jgi:hypothetical protein
MDQVVLDVFLSNANTLRITLEINLSGYFALAPSKDVFSYTRVPASGHFGKHMLC